MSTPSKGALCAAKIIGEGIFAGTVKSQEHEARIIDSHTNAIADELAEALRLALPFICFSDNEGRSPDDYPEVVKMINTQRADVEAALVRYQQLKAKETP